MAALWRPRLITWLYAITLAHLLVGLLLPWCAGWTLLEPYHRLIEQHFWGGLAPAAARAQQQWWLALFGATLQNLSIYMLALIRICQQRPDARIWAALIAGLLLWAPQDMLFSASAGVWPNLLVDSLALLVLLPPLLILCRLDRRPPAV